MKRLQNLSYKTLLIILFFSLAGIVFFLKIGGKTTKVSAAWWDDMWHYRKAISVTNSSGSNLTDFQVSVSIGTSQLIADGKMQTDCDDIRITDINGNLLPYWIEENNPGCNQITDTKVWLKANSLPTSGSTVYIYYGNPSANNNENGDSVFEFFDDFENGTSKWNFETGVTSSIITESNKKILALSNTTTWKGAFAGNENMNNYCYESRMKTSNTRTGLYFRHKSAGDTDNGFYFRAEGDNFGYSQNDGGLGAYGSYTLDANTWYNTKIIAIGTSASLFINNINQNISQAIQNTTGNIGISPIEPASIGYYDYVFIRKYAASEPTVSNQSEESGGGPIAYWKFDEGIGTTIYDSSSNQNNGVFSTGSSAPTWTDESQCISGKCLSFDGINDHLETGTTKPVSANFSRTISVWVKSNDYGDRKEILNWFGTFLNIQGSKVCLYINGANTAYLCSNNNLVTNQWNHIVVIYENSSESIYINGKLDKSAASSAASSHSGDGATIGICRYCGYTSPFLGLIDDVKIYPYARTATQIKTDYNSRGSINGSSANLGIKSNTAPSLKSSLVAYYKFDENNGTTVSDSSGNKLNGTFGTGNSAPTWVNEGKSGKALSFNGTSNYLNINDPGTNSSLDLTNNLTISAWVKKTQDSNYSVLIDKSYSSSWSWYLHGNGSMQIDAMVNGTYVSGWVLTSANIFQRNIWQHIVWTYDGTTAKIFVNGVKQNITQKANTGPLGVNNSPIKIGIRSDNYGPFNGLIDEVKVYNRALTAEEIKQDYNAGSSIQFGTTNQTIGGTTTSLNYCIPGDTSPCTPPVAEWNFEENTGTAAKDTSGNNNNGTFGTGNSAPTWSVGTNNKGSGLKFDGTNDYASATLNGTSFSDFSYELWFKTNTVSGNAGILQWANTLSAGSPMVYIDRYNSNIRLYNSGSYSSSIPINPNTWYQLSAVYSAGTTKTDIYLNGILKTTFNKQLTLQSQGVTMYFGNGYNGFFDGSIDGVKIYSYARTPAQVAYDYNKGAPIGWWKFDECQGSTVFDSSGLGSSGAISIGLSGSQTTLGTCQTGTSAAWTNGSSGHTNGSLSFDGSDDYVTIPSSIAPKLGSSNFTLSFWTYRTASGYQYGSYISKGTYTDGIDTYDNIFRVNTSTGELAHVTLSATLNKWEHHLFVVSQTSTPYISHYINGVLNNTGYVGVGNTGTYPADSYDLIIGKSIAGGVSRLFFGQIDDVRIYNYALTPEQVKQVYNGGAVNFQ